MGAQKRNYASRDMIDRALTAQALRPRALFSNSPHGHPREHHMKSLLIIAHHGIDNVPREASSSTIFPSLVSALSEPRREICATSGRHLHCIEHHPGFLRGASCMAAAALLFFFWFW